ncbi:hypothetical protein CKO28_18725 [Rhodovibrio sodomensis]|uniref:Uncharacterized protein n=1 Tax=Rhodovibrio sodomensis TaxID=1088 RepID=A0ABS1DK29_9PROT|nr:hypothetical protein [Rhodovibrio sodomensis]MBK1670073.1 hypothetical protein [Rhodovibrio sodomensis]
MNGIELSVDRLEVSPSTLRHSHYIDGTPYPVSVATGSVRVNGPHGSFVVSADFHAYPTPDYWTVPRLRADDFYLPVPQGVVDAANRALRRQGDNPNSPVVRLGETVRAQYLRRAA